MTEPEIERIEKSLGITFTPHHREMFLNGSDDFEDFRDDPDSTAGLYCEYHTADEVISDTMSCRDTESFGLKWPDTLITFASFNSHTFFIDLEDAEPTLYWRDCAAEPFYHPDTYKTECLFD